MSDKPPVQPENPPAFPQDFSTVVVDEQGRKKAQALNQYPGMSLRDYFAGQIIGHVVASSLTPIGAEVFSEQAKVDGYGEYEVLVKLAYQCSDAMLAERAKP